jgi:hypothetical protein
MSEQDPGPVEATDEAVPAETGNYPDPDDGPQDDVEQTDEPLFEEALVDGADLEQEL